MSVSTQNPPDTDVIMVDTASGGDLPIHDRWLLTKASGLRLGTSLNSLGISKTSEISLLSAAESLNCMAEANEYISRKKREHLNEKIKYHMFTL